MNDNNQTLNPQLFNNKNVQKLQTMIEGFDDISQGGLPIGRTTLVRGTPGTGKT